ncbi:MAG: O-antigen ligase family protein [Patescibacteria group bacterium]|nr:O-antigen ligase family protein [Patescibacteria group bacterium]
MFIKIFSSLFLLSLVFGQFGGIQIMPGVRVFVHDILLSLCLVGFILHRVRQKRPIHGRLIKPALYFSSFAGVSLLLNTGGFSHLQLLLGSLYLWRFLLYFGLYIIVRNESLSPAFWRLGIYAVGVIVACLGLIQYVFFPSLRGFIHHGWDEHYYRLFSTFLDPNFVGLFLVLSFFLGFSFLSKQRAWGIITSQTIVGVAIVLTHSRSTFLAFFLGLLLFIVLTRKIILISIVFVGIILYLLVPSYGIDTNRLLRSDSTFARIESYAKSIAAARIAPIFGIGYNMLRFQAARERMLDVDGVVSRDAGGFNSSLMVIFVTTGIVGFSFFLYLLYHIASTLYASKTILSYASISGFFAILVHSFFNNSLLYAWTLLWVWILVGSIEKEVRKR